MKDIIFTAVAKKATPSLATVISLPTKVVREIKIFPSAGYDK